MQETIFEDEEALIQKYRPAIKGIARKYAFNSDFDDLEAEGLLACVLAIRNYNPEEKMSLKTHVLQRTKYAILVHITKNKSLSYTPYRVQVLAGQIDRNGLQGKSPEEISEILDKPVNQIRNALMVTERGDAVYLDAVVNSEVGPDVYTYESLIGHPDDLGALDVYRFFKKLSPRCQHILRLRHSGHTQTEVGEALGISQSQVGREIMKIRKLYSKEFDLTTDGGECHREADKWCPTNKRNSN